jgi:hypothetical protein
MDAGLWFLAPVVLRERVCMLFAKQVRQKWLSQTATLRVQKHCSENLPPFVRTQTCMLFR